MSSTRKCHLKRKNKYTTNNSKKYKRNYQGGMFAWLGEKISGEPSKDTIKRNLEVAEASAQRRNVIDANIISSRLIAEEEKAKQEADVINKKAIKLAQSKVERIKRETIPSGLPALIKEAQNDVDRSYKKYDEKFNNPEYKKFSKERDMLLSRLRVTTSLDANTREWRNLTHKHIKKLEEQILPYEEKKWQAYYEWINSKKYLEELKQQHLERNHGGKKQKKKSKKYKKKRTKKSRRSK